jgi:hypothetical protein
MHQNIQQHASILLPQQEKIFLHTLILYESEYAFFPIGP